jgi:hypothetical protein
LAYFWLRGDGTPKIEFNPPTAMTHIPSASLAPNAATVRRISWGAVVAGAVVAVVLHLLLVLLGMAVGLAVVDADNAGAVGTGAAIWWAICSLVSLFAGAWVAARLSGVPDRMDGMLQGLVVWSVTTLLSIYLLTSAIGAVTGGAMKVLSGAAGMAREVAPQAAPLARQIIGPIGGGEGASVAEVLQEIEGSLTGPNAAAARQELRQIFSQAQDGELNSPQFRQRVVTFLTQRGEMDRARAESLADRAISGYRDAKQRLGELTDRAGETAEEAADATAKAALWAFIALLLGAIAAAFGGRTGAPDTIVGTTRPVAPVTRR